MLPLAADYPLLNIIWTMLVFFGPIFIWIVLLNRNSLDAQSVQQRNRFQLVLLFAARGPS